VLAGGALAAVYACSLGPRYHRPDVPPPLAWTGSVDASAPEWPAADWWHGFASADLDQFIGEAQRANDDLRAAIARVKEADAQRRIAGAPLLPAVEAQATAQRAPAQVNGQYLTGNDFAPLLTASYELDFWGKIQRLPAVTSGDEFDTLAQTLNGMLDHIEYLIRGISNVSNAIAHDLRTPLAELRSRLEELTTTRPPPAETFAEIDAAVADLDRVMRIFSALLRLAEIDTGARRSGFVRVDAAAVAAEVVEFDEPAAEQKGVRFSFQSEGVAAVAGDPVLLAQVLSNLIDNSLKSVAERGAISVRVGRRADGAVEIAVADDGPGIADADKPKATERFFRGDASRGTPGGARAVDRRGGREAARRDAAAARQPSGPAGPDGVAGYCRAVESMKASRSRFILAMEAGFTYIMWPAS
jgi:signal transduction histidine kinase